MCNSTQIGPNRLAKSNPEPSCCEATKRTTQLLCHSREGTVRKCVVVGAQICRDLLEGSFCDHRAWITIHNQFFPCEFHVWKKARGRPPVQTALKVARVRQHQPLQAMWSQRSGCRLAQKIISDPSQTLHPEYRLFPEAGISEPQYRQGC